MKDQTLAIHAGFKSDPAGNIVDIEALADTIRRDVDRNLM